MEKLKELLKNKKIIVGLVAVLGIATVGTAFALNQLQQPKETAHQEMIDEEHSKLMASIKSMQEADAQAKIKADEEKKQAEEKAKAEAEAKEKEEAEKKQTEEAQQPTNTTASSNENNSSNNTSVASNNATEASSKPATPTVAPKPQPKPADSKPTPAQEKPKPIKYCEYNGPRKPVQNICNNGAWDATSPTGWSSDSYVVKKAVQRVLDGTIEKMVFHGERDRYHLITTDYLRKGLENTPGSLCYINGSCIGFSVEE